MGEAVNFQMKFNLNFDEKAFDAPIDRAAKKVIVGTMAYTRTVARNLIKTGAAGDVSKPGQPPIGHDGPVRYKDFIFYSYDQGRQTAVCGAVRLPRNDSERVPEIIESGGTVTLTRTSKFTGVTTQTVVNYEPRPHMKTAHDIAVAKKLPELLANSIVK